LLVDLQKKFHSLKSFHEGVHEQVCLFIIVVTLLCLLI